MTDRSQPTRTRVFDYASDIDPEMSAFGWKYIALSYLAVVLPLAGVALPRDGETRWAWFGLIVAFAAVTLALNGVYLRRMIASDGWGEPPPVVVLGQAVTATVVTGCVNYALSGPGGFYRPMILIPTVLVAIIGNRPMVAVSWFVALVTLTTSTWAQGTEAGMLPAVVLSHGITWGLMIVMIHLLSGNALGSARHTQGIADAAAIAARADTLVDGLDRVLPVIGAWAVADRVTAYRSSDTDGDLLIAHWPDRAEPCPAPAAADLHLARGDGGATVLGGRAVIVAERDGDGAVAVVVEGAERGRLDALSYQFHLQRMALQLEMLVSRSEHIEHLESLGRTDSLTGLPNRRALEERLDLERAITRRRGEPLSLAMLDLDDFKAYNDANGHPAGDDLLRRFAAELRASVRAADFVARYGGEEFCILLPDTGPSGAEARLEQIRMTLRSLPTEDLPAFSAGIASSDGNETPQELLERADTALYAAKARGKDRSVLAASAPHPRPAG